MGHSKKEYQLIKKALGQTFRQWAKSNNFDITLAYQALDRWASGCKLRGDLTVTIIKKLLEDLKMNTNTILSYEKFKNKLKGRENVTSKKKNKRKKFC